METNVIYNEDCIGENGMCQLPDNSVDLIITDPPYNVSKSKSFKNSDGSLGFKGWKPIKENWDSMPEPDYKKWIFKILKECKRVLKKEGSIYINMGMEQLHNIGLCLEKLEFKILNIIAWYQPNKFPQNYGKTRYNPATEMIYFARKGKSHYFNYQGFMRDNWEFNTVQGDKRKHPAQKPVKLYGRCVKHSCPDNGIVLDPFMGSGTTAVACLKNNREFIGFEKEEKYYNIALKRIGKFDKSYYKELPESERPAQKQLF